MKQLHITFLLAVLMSMVGAKALAYDAKIDGIYYNFSGTTATVTSLYYASTNNSSAYSGSVVIPETVTYNGTTYSVTSIGDYAFYNCSGLTSVTIPNSVTIIGNSAFFDCSGLTSIAIPNSVTGIGTCAFEGTTWYNNQPDGLVYAGKVAYHYKGEMPENTEITLNDGTSGIANDAFFKCKGLTSITIPNSVTIIGYDAFGYCTGLTSITIPNSVTTIGDFAFDCCKGLTSITIGSGVNIIGYSTFAGCPYLADVYCYAENVPNTNNNAFNVSYIENATLHVPDASLNAYKTTDPWSKFGTIVGLNGSPVIVTASSYTRQYGEENPVFEYTSEGAELNGVPSITCEATATSPVGEYPIIISKGNVTNYNDTYVNGKLTITKAPLTIKGGTYTMKQGEELPTFIATYEGFKNGETEDVLTTKPTLSTTATSASEPGDYEVTVSGAAAQNYEISYVPGTLTITNADPVTVTAKSYTIAYGDELPTFEYTSEGATLTGEPSITCSATATSPVGEYPIVISKGSVTNYNDTYVNGTLTITKAPLTIKGGTYTMKQGEELPMFIATYEGFKNGETEDVLTTKPTLSTTATSASDPGDYEVTVSGAEAQNYEISYVPGTLTITPAAPVTVTAKSYTIAYGDALPTFEYTSEGATLLGVPSITCSANSTSPVGEYPIIISKGSVTNYNDTYVNGKLTITKAPLTIKGGTYTMKQGEELPTFTATYEGFKNGETEDVLTMKPTLTTTATSASEPGDYEVTVSGAEAQNYEISYVPGTLTITVSDGIGLTPDLSPMGEGSYYTLDGQKLNGKPTQKGVYIQNGRKIIVK